MNTDDILFFEKSAKSGIIGEVILDRPKALNALTMDMCQRFGEKLKQWETNDDITAVIVKGNGDRAFCAGGDIRKLYENKSIDSGLLSEFFWHEYRLNAFIHHFSKPFFAFLHHITMGGGAGVSIHGNYRIATEDLIFAMPETKIGFYPDIGANYFLNQCPGHTGLYLALTGNTISATDAYQLGLVTHLVAPNQFEQIETALLKAQDISEKCLSDFVIGPSESKLSEHIETINHCFSENSLDSILQRLENNNDWTKEIANQLKIRSPTSLKITFEAYHRAQKMKFDDIMQMDFDVSQYFLNENDFFEGVRTLLLDKDQTPQWQTEIPDGEMKKYFEFKGKKLF